MNTQVFFTRAQVRNFTTGKLHSSMDDVYEFANKYCTFNDGWMDDYMTHHLPSVKDAISPILKRHLDASFFDDKYDTSNLDDKIELPKLSESEIIEYKSAFAASNTELWNKLGNKK
jgi:hypothetical protein